MADATQCAPFALQLEKITSIGCPLLQGASSQLTEGAGAGRMYSAVTIERNVCFVCKEELDCEGPRSTTRDPAVYFKMTCSKVELKKAHSKQQGVRDTERERAIEAVKPLDFPTRRSLPSPSTQATVIFSCLPLPWLRWDCERPFDH